MLTKEETMESLTKSLREKWDVDPELQAEFGSDFAVYEAYETNFKECNVTNCRTLVDEYMAKYRCNLRTAQRAVKENMKISIEPLKTKWNADAELRAEFGDNFEGYRSYMENFQS